jgi:hypothetical protein
MKFVDEALPRLSSEGQRKLCDLPLLLFHLSRGGKEEEEKTTPALRRAFSE